MKPFAIFLALCFVLMTEVSALPILLTRATLDDPIHAVRASHLIKIDIFIARLGFFGRHSLLRSR